MNRTFSLTWLSSLVLLALAPASVGQTGANVESGGSDAQVLSSPRPSEQKADSKSDRSIAEYQSELLDLAFQAASKIPTDPHHKDRARAQEAVVAACLELDQPQLALRYLKRIDNWRRGYCYADLAFHLAERGQTDNVQRYLNLAEQIAQTAADWRRDRIRVRIAQTHVLLGQTEKAASFEADVVDSEAGKVHAIQAQTLDNETFDQQMQAVNELAGSGNFDLMRNAIAAYAAMFDRVHEDADRRARVKAAIDETSATLPVMIRADNLFELAGFAIDPMDQTTALALVNEAQGLLDATSWSAEDEIPYRARLTRLRFLAGDEKKARTDADALREQFEAQRESIVNIYRTEALCPLAEAYQAMKDETTALAVYKLAVEEGVVNPNSRPRAEDLSAACCSMAVNGVEPDADLWSRMRQIFEELGHPW